METTVNPCSGEIALNELKSTARILRSKEMDLSVRNSKDDFMRTVDVNTPGCLCGAEIETWGSDHRKQTKQDSDNLTINAELSADMTGEDGKEIDGKCSGRGIEEISVKLKSGQFSDTKSCSNSDLEQTSNSDLQMLPDLVSDVGGGMDLKKSTCKKCNKVKIDNIPDANISTCKSYKETSEDPSKENDKTRFVIGDEDSENEQDSLAVEPVCVLPQSRSTSRLSSIDEGRSLSNADMESETYPVNVEFNPDSTVSVELPPCDCDDCILNEQDDASKKKGMTMLKRQSSWKIIRSIVRWSPFVQVFKKNKYPWIQLAGHQGNFQAGESGAVLKKLDSREKQCYLKLMSDTLKLFVPEYRGDTEKCGDKYIQLQDLLCEFNTPCVMDIKMGCRTYLEEELEKARSKPTLRKDMYKKMIEVDPNAPSPEEKEKEGVTKARYLQWRDEMSSSVNLGFRIEGIKKSDGTSSKDFKKTKTRDHVHEKLKSFIGENTNAVSQYIERLRAISVAQEGSEFFQRHEVISSSLLFVHDSEKANVWMIDFGKTEPLPPSIQIDHRRQWSEGNHEDGYLAGLDRLISIFTDLLNES